MSKISVKAVASGQVQKAFGSRSDIILEISVHDPSLIGRSATLTIARQVKVKEVEPVNKDDKIERSFVLRQNKIEIPVSRKHLQCFSYEGEKIDVSVNVILKVDTGFLFDTKIHVDANMGFLPRTRVPVEDDEEVIEPKDEFSFLKNMTAIPANARMVVVYLGFLAGLFLVINTIIGVHDQFVSEAMTWVYSHRNSDGETISPLMVAMGANFAAAAAAWFAIRRELRRYMSFRLTSKPSMFTPGTKFQVKDLISGIPRVHLKSAELRIVACNLEKGSYMTGSRRNRREATFSYPVRAMTLYKKKVSNLPAGLEINVHFPEEISFDDIYKKLYPAQMLTKTHGIDLYWEVQLLHEAYVDQELVGPTEHLKYQYFFSQNDVKGDALGGIDLDPQDKRKVG
jgi:hypothetical protein